MSGKNKDPLPSQSWSVEINDIKTDILCAKFNDRNLVVITQFEKFGSVMSVTNYETQTGCSFQTKPLMGKDDQIMHVFARAIAEVVYNANKSKVPMENALPFQNNPKPLLCTLAIKDLTPATLSEICKILKSSNVWSSEI